MATGRVLSSADSLPLDWSLPSESPSDGLSLTDEGQKVHFSLCFQMGVLHGVSVHVYFGSTCSNISEIITVYSFFF